MADIVVVQALEQAGEGLAFVGVAAGDGQQAMWGTVIDNTQDALSDIHCDQLLTYIGAAEQVDQGLG